MKKIAFWIGKNNELNILVREEIIKYSDNPQWDVVLFSEYRFVEPVPKLPTYNMFDYDGLIVVDSIEKLTKTKELFGAKVVLYLWEDNWGPGDFLTKLTILNESKIIVRNELDSNRLRLTWGFTPISTALYPNVEEIYAAAR